MAIAQEVERMDRAKAEISKVRIRLSHGCCLYRSLECQVAVELVDEALGANAFHRFEAIQPLLRRLSLVFLEAFRRLRRDCQEGFVVLP